MSEHTPGPWRVYIQDVTDKEHAKRELCQLVDGTPNFQPHLVYVTDDDWELAPAITGCGEHSKANARLIAAAPELLDPAKEFDRLALVIESAVRRTDPRSYEAVLAAIKANRAAIAKATGQQEKAANLLVSCRCGWSGSESALVPGMDSGRDCPRCHRAFKPWPT